MKQELHRTPESCSVSLLMQLWSEQPDPLIARAVCRALMDLRENTCAHDCDIDTCEWLRLVALWKLRSLP